MIDDLERRLRADAAGFAGPPDLDAVMAGVERRRRAAAGLRLGAVAVIAGLALAGVWFGLTRSEPVVVETAAPDVDGFFRDVRAADLDGIRSYALLGGDLDATDANGFTGVLLASVRDDDAVVAELLALGADADLLGDDGESALHYAARFGQVEITRTLLDGGADPDVVATSRDRPFPLHLAASRGEVEIVRALLDAGADPDVRTEAGAPVLEVALRGDPSLVVPLLLDAGADAGVDTPWGPIPDLARERGLDDLAELMEASLGGS